MMATTIISSIRVKPLFFRIVRSSVVWG